MNSSDKTLPEAKPIGETLMAYLDGELDSELQQQLEEQLRSDVELRRQVKELQQTWDMLDELPREQVDDDFTRITVEMVAVHAEGEAEQRARRVSRWRWLALTGGLAVACIAAVAGYAITNYRLTEANRKLLDELPILQQLDAYQTAGSMDFLRALEREGLFKEEDADAN